jgi:hypothetical protein
MCVCVCVCVYIYTYIHTYIHTGGEAYQQQSVTNTIYIHTYIQVEKHINSEVAAITNTKQDKAILAKAAAAEKDEEKHIQDQVHTYILSMLMCMR